MAPTYTIVLFSQNDKTGVVTERELNEAGPELKKVLTRVENRYHVLNNDRVDDRGQVLDLLEKVDKMVSANGGQYYTNYTYMEVMEMLAQRVRAQKIL